MMSFILFLLSTAGLVSILTKSILFKSVREYFSLKDVKEPVTLDNPYNRKSKYKFWWFLNSIFNCSLCCGVWTSILIYWLIYRDIQILTIALCFAGAFVSHFFSELIDKIKR